MPDAGLINRSWTVGAPPRAVLQRVNPIFDPRVQLDIEAVTEHLAQAHLPTPRLLRTRSGDLFVAEPEAFWRLMTYVPGRTLHRLPNARAAASAGDLVGRFHAALDDLRWDFKAPRRLAHDTPLHMVSLEQALESCENHPLRAVARDLGREILERWKSWQGDLVLPSRIGHGDLKVSNVRFAGSGDLAVCLIDLDTLGPMPLPEEMGDAWRSWCNPATEDEPDEAEFSLELFSASALSWAKQVGPIRAIERRNLAPTIERICLELAARFSADTVRNDYFTEDRTRWPEPGRHNLLRARGQLELARSVRAQRAEIDAVVVDLSFS